MQVGTVIDFRTPMLLGPDIGQTPNQRSAAVKRANSPFSKYMNVYSQAQGAEASDYKQQATPNPSSSSKNKKAEQQ